MTGAQHTVDRRNTHPIQWQGPPRPTAEWDYPYHLPTALPMSRLSGLH